MEDLLEQVVQRLQRQYYGKYRGFVMDNRDPEKRGRLKLKVPTVLGNQDTGWALPCLPFGVIGKGDADNQFVGGRKAGY